MDISELTAWLTDGLPADQAAVVKAAIERDATKSKVAGLKQQAEFDTLQARAQVLQQEIEDQGQPGTANFKPGSRSYQNWYKENIAKIQQMNADLAKYQEKYGTLEAPKSTPAGDPTVKNLTDAEIAALVDSRIQQQYSPKWSELIKGATKLTVKHLMAGRKTEPDIDAIAQLAEKKYNGDLQLAYDEWDKPEREKDEKAKTDAEIDRRVKEELQKRGASRSFPSGADLTPSALSSRTKADLDKFDEVGLKNDLANLWIDSGTTKAA